MRTASVPHLPFRIINRLPRRKTAKCRLKAWACSKKGGISPPDRDGRSDGIACRRFIIFANQY
ncbi:hypothetical protein C2G14_08915 [Neisseria gonorrhoeae]|nr:hypothetical protein EGO68_09675 [Neisseria gonorrhoeae]ROU35207.1 hypothetical protein EGP28_10140 [Neisseria gonorrhoeae]ROU39173.1 hypothetical protein EGO63_10010 [Neisseria gonorrhoeae]ROU64905.1 hypothetical protein EGO65_09900 [Neisseria gonorrhoeae]ROV18856.1 hypothetical protein EGP31_03400 [Neisseria gonorrhoeae]